MVELPPRRRDRDRDRDRRSDGRHHRHKESRRRSHSKERSAAKHSSRRERSRTRSPARDRGHTAAVDSTTTSSTSTGSHSHSQHHQSQPPTAGQRKNAFGGPPAHQHLTHRQERDASKAEQLRKMGIEYGVANAGCNGNSINLAAAYAVQQALLRNSQPTQLQQYQQQQPTASTVHHLLPQALLPQIPRPAIPSLLSLGVTNPNAPQPSTATAAAAAARPPISLLSPGAGNSITPLLVPLLALNAAATSASAAPGSLSSLTNFTTPSILASARYTEQMQKRKLLWGNKKTPAVAAASSGQPNGAADAAAAAAAATADGSSTAASAAGTAVQQPLTNNKWEETRFSQDTDGKVASKFLRLMGMKDATPKPSEVAAGSAVAGGSSTAPDAISKQNELFSTMEHQYEVARQVTHTMRGMGLGFGTQPRQF